MALTGYTKSHERKHGGVRSIALIPRMYLTSATYNDTGYAYTAFSFSGTTRFEKYEFEEDEAYFKEVVHAQRGSFTVTHEIAFSLERMSGEVTYALNELLKNHSLGMIALVQTTNGDLFVVGYSEEFKGERALRIASMEGMTGSKLTDAAGERVVLRSEDVAKSRSFFGDTSTIYA